MAVNGLRKREVSRDLLKIANLTWVLLKEALKARETANNADRFLKADSRGSDLKSEIKKEVARVSECDSHVLYWSGGDRGYVLGNSYYTRSSPRSGKKYYRDSSNERDVSRYGARSREYNNDRDSRKYRDNSREKYVSRYGANNREGSEDRVCHNCKCSNLEM